MPYFCTPSAITGQGFEISGCGEIGRRTRLRIWRRKACRFDPYHPHNRICSLPLTADRQGTRNQELQNSKFLVPCSIFKSLKTKKWQQLQERTLVYYMIN